MLYEICLFTRLGVKCVCVGHVANLCITRSETMHLTRTCEMRDSRIVQRILNILRMTTVACYLISAFVCLPFVISIA
jgi:hypothetical protein